MLLVHIIAETFYSDRCSFVMMQVQLEVINKSTMNSDFDTLVSNGLRSLSLSGQALPGRDQPPYCYIVFRDWLLEFEGCFLQFEIEVLASLDI